MRMLKGNQVFEFGQDGQMHEVKQTAFQVGQILWLNGYGQSQHHHEREAIYKIEEDSRWGGQTLLCVNLDRLTLTRHDSRTVRPVEKLFGIGTYFTPGDFATEEEITNALPLAQENDQKARDERKRQEEEQEQAQNNARVLFHSLKPTWAKAAIIGELEQDQSDSMSDYYGSRTVRQVLLGWSRSARNNFNEMRTAARNCPMTAPLADLPDSCNHRDNYSMGNGYWLGEDRYSGWQVSKMVIYSEATYPSLLTEADVFVKEGQEQEAQNPPVTGDAEIRYNQAKGGIEIHFRAKPSRDVLDQLKANGWRWARFNACWYAKNSATARAFAERITGAKAGGDIDPAAGMIEANENAPFDEFARGLGD